MGCDIHMYVEKKVDGKWLAVKGVNPDIATYRGYSKTYIERGDTELAERYAKLADKIESGEALKEAEEEYDRMHNGPMVLADWLYDGRNYDLFAILAGVRNGRGFAGSYTGEGFNPISEPKGVPDDISEAVKEAYDYWESDGHSHSWLTLQELEEYNWDQTTKMLKPGSYPIDASKEFLEEHLAKYSYKESAGKFYAESIPKLREVADGEPESVRIVFWFDN